MQNSSGIPSLQALTPEADAVPVVSAVDANFVPVYSVFLASLLAHAGADRTYDLILLTEDVPEDAVRALQLQLRRHPNVSLRTVDMTGFAVPYLERVGFRKPAFFRLAITDILPAYAKAVYLDTDTILLEDPAKLYDALGFGFAAAVPDITMHAYAANPEVREDYLEPYGNIRTYWERHLTLSERARERYFNSGVTVFNLEKMRRHRIPERLASLLREKPYVFPDQDILNIAFDGDIQPLPLSWNFFQALNPRLQYPQATLEERSEAAKHINLIHFAWKKPWLEAAEVPYQEYFWFYARQSVYYEVLAAIHQKAAQPPHLRDRLKQRLTGSAAMRAFRGRFPAGYNAMRTLWRKIRHG